MLAGLAGLAVARPASADTAWMFGYGPRSAGVAQADVAAGTPADATRTNAALASAAGVRIRIGYGYSALGLSFDGKDAGLGHASGVDVTGQLGKSLGQCISIGMALGLHLPDSSLGKVTFRPATDPQFLLYEASLQRTTFDTVIGGRYGLLSVGAGTSIGLSVAGNGTRFDLGQDAHGTMATSNVDVSLPLKIAPILGARADFGRVAVGITYRGAMSLDVNLENDATIALQNNPLNGKTQVKVTGSTGYDPATLVGGARVRLGGGVSALAALEVAFWQGAPPPSADVAIAAQLGVTPGIKQTKIGSPNLHDTVSPRLGIEARRPGGPKISADEWVWAARAGYSLHPSPVPDQAGITTYADATRHEIAIGGGYHLGKLAGVDLAIDAAAQLHLLAPRTEDKPDPSLPYAHFEVGGHILHGSAALEATW